MKVAHFSLMLMGLCSSQLVLPLTNHDDNQLTMKLSISSGPHELLALDLNVDTGSSDLVFVGHKCNSCDNKTKLKYAKFNNRI